MENPCSKCSDGVQLFERLCAQHSGHFPGRITGGFEADVNTFRVGHCTKAIRVAVHGIQTVIFAQC